ncbi:MAG: hypothetical protein LW850_03760 [Planctomycetaceae bacterium]|nr:hypothetical protein [Planctomycetaceae bacterium]
MTDKKLSGKRVLTFVGDIYEDLELWYPKLRLIEEGALPMWPSAICMRANSMRYCFQEGLCQID